MYNSTFKLEPTKTSLEVKALSHGSTPMVGHIYIHVSNGLLVIGHEEKGT